MSGCGGLGPSTDAIWAPSLGRRKSCRGWDVWPGARRFRLQDAAALCVLEQTATEPSTLQLTSTVLTNEWCINLKAMNAALDNIFSAKQHKYNTYLKKKKMSQPWRANSSSSIRARPVVTFTWTRPTQTQEIVLPPAPPYIICVIQCLRVTEGSSSTQPADCSPHPHRRAWLQTFTYHSRWSDHRCAHGRYAHMHMQKSLSALTCLLSGLSHTHKHTHTGAHCTLHPCSG